MSKKYKLPEEFLFFDGEVLGNYEILSTGANIKIIAKSINKARFLVQEYANKNGANVVIIKQSKKIVQNGEEAYALSVQAVFVFILSEDGKELKARDLSAMKDYFFDDVSTDINKGFFFSMLFACFIIAFVLYYFFSSIIF